MIQKVIRIILRILPTDYYGHNQCNEKSKRKRMRKLIWKGNMVHWLLSVAYLVSAVLTVLPSEIASKNCRLG